MVTLSTIMLILLQHNAAHLGIVTGLCLSEASTKYLPKWLSRPILATAMMASIATALAEILGGAIALNFIIQYTTCYRLYNHSSFLCYFIKNKFLS